ncbi:hypothetical protein PoB_007336400 [Plakobranchus ocellatus]|uniref:Uncharacterized protein n=1 Tax=Plakobranchus ocellatus TaxID=259542 RepID=A0AAV4DS82_9GAST|nr:hypothetical protein PoB_007336400 [Plakobranchus ocellatus]
MEKATGLRKVAIEQIGALNDFGIERLTPSLSVIYDKDNMRSINTHGKIFIYRPIKDTPKKIEGKTTAEKIEYKESNKLVKKKRRARQRKKREEEIEKIIVNGRGPREAYK